MLKQFICSILELSVSITTHICIFDHNKLAMELTLATDKPVAAKINASISL